MKIYSDDMIKRNIEKKNKRKKVIEKIFYPIIIFITICALAIVYQKVIQKKEDANLFGYKPYIIMSGSMEPTLQVGDIIISKQIIEEDIKINDIITFVDESENTVTHRIVDVKTENGKKLYQTKGDNNNVEDDKLVEVEEIKGKYVFKISKVGKLFNLIMTPIGLIILGTIVAIIYMIKSKKEDRKTARHFIREIYKKQDEIQKK